MVYCNIAIRHRYDYFYKNASFNKGGAIKLAQEHVYSNKKKSNILLLDGDICLPNDFINKIPKNIEDNTLYGVSKRFDYWTLDDYINDTNSHYYMSSDHFVGFFQLYNSTNNYKYNDSYHCGGCDDKFRDLFQNKIKLDLSVKHLGKECENWYGRNSNISFISTNHTSNKKPQRKLKVQQIKRRR